MKKSLRSIGVAAVLIGASVGYGWAAGDVAKGALFVKSRCGQCHTVERGGPNKIGPNLFGVFGRRAAAAAGYTFSGAMQKSGIVWTADKLLAYLKNPRATVPGTKMTYAGIVRDEDNANTVAYLATLK